MNSRQRRAYIKEIFKFCTTDSILVIDQKGQLRRLVCPFMIIVIVAPLKKGQEKAVIAVKVSENLIDIYIIEGKGFYYYNFNPFFALANPSYSKRTRQ